MCKRLLLPLFLLLASPALIGAQTSTDKPASQYSIPDLPRTPDLPPSVPASGQLTLSQAVQIGLKDNPQIMASKFAVVSAH